MGVIKKMVTDSNAVAQEKGKIFISFPSYIKKLDFKYCFSFLILGLDCVLLFTENCKSANKVVGEVKKKTDLLCGKYLRHSCKNVFNLLSTLKTHGVKLSTFKFRIIIFANKVNNVILKYTIKIIIN